jgi:hypothetical protein
MSQYEHLPLASVSYELPFRLVLMERQVLAGSEHSQYIISDVLGNNYTGKSGQNI